MYNKCKHVCANIAYIKKCKTNKYNNVTFLEHQVLTHNYATGIMDTDSITSADAKEAETSSQSKHLESKNKGRGVKSSS